MQLDSFEKEVVAYVKPNHGTTTLGFIFKDGVIIAVDSRATQGSYIGMPTGVPLSNPEKAYPRSTHKVMG